MRTMKRQSMLAIKVAAARDIGQQVDEFGERQLEVVAAADALRGLGEQLGGVDLMRRELEMNLMDSVKDIGNIIEADDERQRDFEERFMGSMEDFGKQIRECSTTQRDLGRDCKEMSVVARGIAGCFDDRGDRDGAHGDMHGGEIP